MSDLKKNKTKPISARTAKIKEKSIVKAAHENLSGVFFYQPYGITMLKADMSPLQINIMVQLLELFQARFKEQLRLMFNGTSISDYDVFLGQESPIIKIPFKDLELNSHEYKCVKAATDQLALLVIRGEYMDKSTGVVRDQTLPLFSMITTPSKRTQKEISLEKGEVREYKMRRLGFVELQLNKVVAQQAFRMDNKYTRYLKEITRGRKSSYTPRMYMFIATFASIGSWTIDYIELRKMLGVTISNEVGGVETLTTVKYEKFSSFKQRILEPPMKELKTLADEHKVDCYYKYDPIYSGGKKKGDPDKIHFRIYKTDFGLELETQSRIVKEQSELFEYLTREFHFEESDNKILGKMITSDNMESFKSKVNEIKTYVTDPKNKVRSVKLYAFKSLLEFLRKMQPVEQEQIVVQEVPKESADIPVAEEKPQSSLSPEEEVRWALAQEKMARYSTDEQCKLWFSSLKLEKIESNELLIIVPNPFIYNMIENKYLAVLDKSIHEVYGDDAEVCYRIAAQ